MGTSVMFLSADVEHEVLPSLQTRYSIAAWFRRRELGKP
jgi:SM-20-related protein